MALSNAKTALVWGVSGISGMACLQELVKKPKSEWIKIIGVSRKPIKTDIKDDRVEFVSMDVLETDVDVMASQLRAVGGEEISHAFHYTYIEKSNEEELIQVNTLLLEKALKATAAVSNHVKIFELQTGYKYYGAARKEKDAHSPTPFREDTPRSKYPNFYFNQEDLAKSFCLQRGWNYIITRPNFIIGVSKGNFMNLAVSIALYAEVQKRLGKPFVFPGNQIMWKNIVDHSQASNNAAFQIWACDNPKAWNQAFNIANGDKPIPKDFWPKLASYFGLKLPDKPFSGESAQKEDVPQLNMEEYMKDKGGLWHQIAQENNLDESAWKYATWKFVDFAFGRTVEDNGSLEKARSIGWDKYLDTVQGYYEAFDEMKRLKIIPSEPIQPRQ